MRGTRCLLRSVLGALIASTASCTGVGSSDATAPPPCEASCQDAVVLRGMREVLKLVYNLTLQGKSVGAHDVTVPCLRGGSARVFGQASSNAVQGATEVELTYVLDRCAYLQKDDELHGNYDLTFTGTLLQKGTLAVQPSSTSAVHITSPGLTVSGTVYDPPLPRDLQSCPVDVIQDGNRVDGILCGRTASVEL